MAGGWEDGMAHSASSQVERWIRFQEILERIAAEPSAPPSVSDQLGPFVAMSREAGSGGAEIGRVLAERLGWSLYDRELVEEIAERLHVAPRFLELLDEARTDWFRDALLELVDARLVHQDTYVRRLGRLMLLAAWEGEAVFVGRGAHLLLPAANGLLVRVVAPRAYRMAQLAQREGLELEAAARRMDELDEARKSYLRRNFRRAEDPGFDIVLDASRLGVEGSVDVIVAGIEARGIGRNA
jgi:cytidylate kinase